MNRPIEDSLSLLVGAGVGMAVMYLLDPAEGLHRRERLQKSASQTLSKVGEQVGQTVEDGADYLQEAVGQAYRGSSLREAAQQAGRTAADYQNRASKAAGSVQSSVNETIDQLRGKAGAFADSAKAQYGHWLNRSTLALGRDEDHHVLSQTACALGSLALGAATVYLIDPQLGQQRRSEVLRGTTYAIRETGEFFRRLGRRMVSQGTAVADLAAKRVREAPRATTQSQESAHPETVQEPLGT